MSAAEYTAPVANQKIFFEGLTIPRGRCDSAAGDDVFSTRLCIGLPSGSSPLGFALCAFARATPAVAKITRYKLSRRSTATPIQANAGGHLHTANQNLCSPKSLLIR
jgi:hypothetical protein